MNPTSLTQLRLIPVQFYGAIVYLTVGLRWDYWPIMWFWLVLLLANLLCSALFMLIGICVRRLATAQLLGTIVALVAMLVSQVNFFSHFFHFHVCTFICS